MQQQIAVVRNNRDLDPSLILGYLLFMHIDELKIHKQDLAQLFKKHNLSSGFLPHEIKAHDAYRRATSRAQQQIYVKHNGGVYKARLLVREVKKDSQCVVRHLVRELIDEKNEKTVYNTVGKFILERQTEAMDISWDANFLSEYDYKKVIEDTRNLYVEWTQYHTKDTVRNICHRIVKSTYPVSIMQGGRAQFIPKRHQDIIFNMKDMVEELPGNSIIEIIPLIDTIDQRNLVTKNLEREVLEDVDRLLADFAELLKNQTIRKSTIKRYAQAVVELQQKTAEYEALLQKKMHTLQSQLAQALNKVQSVQVDDEEEAKEHVAV